MTARRALVTGGCGFVGSTLCRRLADAGYDVLAVDNLSLGSPKALDDRVRLAISDIRDPALGRVVAAHKPALIFHLAAIHFIPACEQDPARAISVNVEGTQRLLEAGAVADVDAFVLASTGAVYAPSEEPHREDSRIGPTDVYGHTKMWAEQIGDLFHQRTDRSVAIARLFNVYGPGETNPHLIPTIIQQASSDGQLHLGNLSTKRNYIYVDDVADGLIAMGVKALESKRLTSNIGGARDYDGEEIVDAIGRVMGRKLISNIDKSRLRKSDRPRLAPDNSWAKDHLGWQPSTTLESGLMTAVEQPLATGIEMD
jgi:UDP-glucose 4-epimerase